MNTITFYHVGGLVFAANGTQHAMGVTDDFGNVVALTEATAVQFGFHILNFE